MHLPRVRFSKIRLGQGILCQEAQGQIGLVFQQVHIFIVVDLFKHGAGAVPAVPVHHVFQVQEQICHRAALLKAIPVVGVFRAIAKGLHELGHPHIGRAGESGNAIVAIERIIVQGLGMGHLCPVEGLFLPLAHIAEHGGRRLLALGIVGNPGAREIQAEGQQVCAHFQNDHRQHRPAGMNPVAALAIAGPGHLGRLRILGDFHLFLAIEQAGCKDKQEAKIVQRINRNLQGNAEGLGGLRVRQVVGAAQHRAGEQHGSQNMPDGKPPPQQPGPIGHIQQHKAEEEAEPVRDHIGEVEAVPNVVQLPDDEAQHEKQQQEYCAQLVPELYFLRHQEEEGQLDRKHAAVQVRKPLLEIGLLSAAHIARHLTHGIQQPLPGILRGNIQPEALGKGIDAGLGGLQGRQGRKLQNGSHANGQQGENRNAHQIQPRPLPAGEPADLIAEEHQRHENADEEAHIVIGVNGQKQRHGVQEESLLPQQGDLPQNDQGQQREGIHPHDVPVEAQSPGAQSIKRAEGHHRKVLLPVELLQKQREEQPRKAQLDGR